MSIKGFSVGGNVERYDYNSLDNLPSEITIDPALSGSSTNPVQNKVVTGAINATTDSVNALSGEVSGLKSALSDLEDGTRAVIKANAITNEVEPPQPVYADVVTKEVTTSGEYAVVGIDGLVIGAQYLIVIDTDYQYIASVRTMTGWKFETNFHFTLEPDYGYTTFSITENTSRLALISNSSAVGKTLSLSVSIYDLTGTTASAVLSALYGETYIITADQIKKAVDNLPAETKAVCCWGDSLTQGDGSTAGYDWVYQLSQTLTDFTVTNKGKSGDSANNILNRQGALNLYIKPFTLPATTDPVAIEFYSNAFGAVRFQSPANARGGLGNCVVGNDEIPCSISLSNGIYYLTRTTVGTQTVFSRPALLKSVTNEAYIKDITTIWAGTNSASYSADDIIIRQKAMVEHLKTDRFIIFGLTCDIRFPSIDDYNAKMAQYWGNHFFDVKRYLIEFGLADNNLTPTTEDEQYIAENKIPRTLLRSDQVHFNDYGYTSIKNGVYAFGKDLGYWN